jgi:hypothetical protein
LLFSGFITSSTTALHQWAALFVSITLTLPNRVWVTRGTRFYNGAFVVTHQITNSYKAYKEICKNSSILW